VRGHVSSRPRASPVAIVRIPCGSPVATQLLKAGTSLEVLKELRGHRAITLTWRYAQLYETTKRTPDAKAMAQIEPRQALSGERPMDDTVRQAIHRFQEYRQRRQYAAHTITNYTLDLQLFFAVCPRPPTHVSFQDIERCIDQQYAQGLAPTTLHRRLHALKHFFDHLLEQRRVAGNPVKPSHTVRRGRPLPKTLSQGQVQQLFAQIHHPMDKALFLLMLRCGLRVSEVVHLTMDDIDWTQQAIRIVQGKGRKDRRVYISPDAVTTLRTCLTLRPTHAVGTSVFWNQKRPQRPLSIAAVQKKMERYATAAGMKTSCHGLRHTFASNLLEHGTELVTVKEFLGHASIASSERYARVSNQKVKQEYLRSMQKILHQSKI
jgi:site-specific recombinase XerD